MIDDLRVIVVQSTNGAIQLIEIVVLRLGYYNLENIMMDLVD